MKKRKGEGERRREHRALDVFGKVKEWKENGKIK